MPYLFMLITLAGAVAAQLLLRKGMLLVGQVPHDFSQIIPFFLRAFTNLYVLGAILLVLIASLAWISAVSRAEALSRVYPLMALSYVLVVLFSAVVLRETVTPLRWFGVIVIGIGVSLVARS